MKYILTQEEMDNVVPKKEFLIQQDHATFLAKAYRNSDACKKAIYCDKCPIASINNGLAPYAKLCPDQELSK